MQVFISEFEKFRNEQWRARRLYG